MKRTKEKTPQLKTLELLIISKKDHNEKLRAAYERMYEHFINEDRVYGKIHKQILEAIYVKKLYRKNTAFGIAYMLHLDKKTFIAARKVQLSLLSIFLFGVDKVPEHFQLELYNFLNE